MIKNDNKKAPKNAQKFFCEKCNFKCSKKSDWDRHISTRKHKLITNGKEITPKNAEFICDCGKIYKHSSGLSRHKMKCTYLEKKDNEDNEKLMQMLKESTETNNKLAEKIKELEEKQSIINNTTIHNNQKVNVNLFLNEDCKYAVSMSDFINMIQPSLEDLMYIR